MRVLFTTWDWSGHLFPMVPLGWALRAAGHEVLVATDPAFAPTVVRAGLPALPVGKGFDSAAVIAEQIKERGWQPKAPQRRTDDVAQNTERTRRRSLLGVRVAVDAAAAQIDDLVEFCRGWRPDLVVYEPFGFTGPLIARLFDIPGVRHLWSMDVTSELAGMGEEIIGGLAARFGLADVDLNGTLTLDPCPASVQVPDGMRRHPIQFVPYNGPAVMPSWLTQPPTRPRICISWGNSLDQFGFGKLVLAPLVAEALADVDAEVVLAISESQRGIFGTLPDNVRHLGPVPLNLLLPSCSALVQQGGAGTTMTGLLHGVPQLVIAHMPHSVMHGHRIEDSGTGRYLPGAEATAELIRDNVLALLSDPGYALAAREARADILARPSVNDVVRDLAELVLSSRRASVA